MMRLIGPAWPTATDDHRHRHQALVQRNGHAQGESEVVFPDWLYDESRVNDLPALLNMKTVEAAYEQLEVEIGSRRRGYRRMGIVMSCSNSNWSAAKAREKIHGSKGVALAALDPYGPGDLRSMTFRTANSRISKCSSRRRPSFPQAQG